MTRIISTNAAILSFVLAVIHFAPIAGFVLLFISIAVCVATNVPIGVITFNTISGVSFWTIAIFFPLIAAIITTTCITINVIGRCTAQRHIDDTQISPY